MKTESPPAKRVQKRLALATTNHGSKRHKSEIVDSNSSDRIIRFDSDINDTSSHVTPLDDCQTNNMTTEANNDKHNKKKRSQSKTKKDAAIDMIWICTECREAECAIDPESPLLVCEGSCMRPFHYPCAGLHTVPNDNEKWICSDCERNIHMCCVCHQYGDDNVDVYKCEKKECGLFFHEACLSMYDHVQVEILGRNDTNSPSEAFENAEEIHNNNDDDVQGSQIGAKHVPGIKFTCPAHFCWTCCGGFPPISSDDPNINVSDDNHNEPNKKGKRKKNKNVMSSAFQEKKETLMVSSKYFHLMNV
jgi:hypothetical protein